MMPQIRQKVLRSPGGEARWQWLTEGRSAQTRRRSSLIALTRARQGKRRPCNSNSKLVLSRDRGCLSQQLVNKNVGRSSSARRLTSLSSRLSCSSASIPTMARRTMTSPAQILAALRISAAIKMRLRCREWRGVELTGTRATVRGRLESGDLWVTWDMARRGR